MELILRFRLLHRPLRLHILDLLLLNLSIQQRQLLRGGHALQLSLRHRAWDLREIARDCRQETIEKRASHAKPDCLQSSWTATASSLPNWSAYSQTRSYPPCPLDVDRAAVGGCTDSTPASSSPIARLAAGHPSVHRAVRCSAPCPPAHSSRRYSALARCRARSATLGRFAAQSPVL